MLILRQSALRVLAIPCVFGLWYLAGCSSEPAAPVSVPSAEEASQKKIAAVSEAIGKTDLQDKLGPEQSVEKFLAATREGKLDEAFDFLPASYQNDVDELVHLFASKMDEELWTRSFDVLKKGVDVLKEKKDLLVQALGQPGNEEASASLSKNWGEIVSALETLVHSDLSNLSKLRTIETRSFLQTTGNRLFAGLNRLASSSETNPLAMLSKVEVKQVHMQDNVAILQITSPDDPAPAETRFVQVEGKWIPEDLAREWRKTVDQFRERLNEISAESTAALKPELQKTLDTTDDVLDQMLDAKTKEEINAAFFPLLLQAMQMGNMMKTQPGPVGGVTIIVEGELDEDAETELLQKLESLTDRPTEATYTSSPSNGNTTIVLKPVSDPVAFAEKLTFAKSKSVHPETRTIRILVE